MYLAVYHKCEIISMIRSFSAAILNLNIIMNFFLAEPQKSQSC